jgi:hypothetical protein
VLSTAPHAAADVAVPRPAAGARGVDPGRAPEPLFEGIGAALVAARDEQRAGGGDRRECGSRVMAVGNIRRIGARIRRLGQLIPQRPIRLRLPRGVAGGHRFNHRLCLRRLSERRALWLSRFSN